MSSSNKQVLTQKQENFTQNIFKGMSQRDAWIGAGYSSNYAVAVIDVNACNLAKKNKIKLRLDELREAVKSENIMTVKERQERLSTFGKEDIISQKGTLLRHGNISAIAELNKMDHVYETGGGLVKNEVKVVLVYTEITRPEETEGQVRDSK